MKKNNLLTNLGFHDPDHKVNRHDSATHFIKQEDILKSILQTLKLNIIPLYTENEYKGFGYEQKLPLRNVILSTIEDVQLETEVPVTKGSNKDNKYTIGFLDGKLDFLVSYSAVYNKQEKHIELEVELYDEEIKLIETKKHPIYFDLSNKQMIFYNGYDQILFNNTEQQSFVTKDKINYYLTNSGHLINIYNQFLLEDPNFTIIATIQDDISLKKGNVVQITDNNMWIVHWENDPKGYTYQNNCGFTLIEAIYVPLKNSFHANKDKFSINSKLLTQCSINNYNLTDFGFFIDGQGSFLNYKNQRAEYETFHIGLTNNYFLCKVLSKKFTENTSVKLTQKQTFHIETKFHPTSASDIVRQVKLYDEYLSYKYPWLILTFFQLSNLEQEELKLAKLNWIHLGGNKFNEWYEQKQKEVIQTAMISF